MRKVAWRVLNGSELRLRPDWALASHRHAFHEFIAIESGHLRVLTRGASLEAGPGTVLVYPSGVAHEEAASLGQPLHLIYVMFEGRLHSGRDAIPLSQFDATGRIRFLLRWILEGLRRASAAATAARVLRLAFDVYCSSESQHFHERLERVRQYVRGHLERSLRLEDLAKQACMSRFHFVRWFAQHVGESPMTYVRRARIDAARALLIRTNEPLRVIARAVGLGDETHMARTFRRETGESPGQFRRRGRDRATASPV